MPDKALATSPFQVGITGGIGSGKSTVCRLFAVLGIPIYYADDRAKALMTEDPALMNALRHAFGDDIYDNAGQLQRAVLAQQVFGDSQALATLNGLVHPAVFQDAASWAVKHQDAPYLLREAALLYESGSWSLMDRMVVVWAPEAMRIARVTARDGVQAAAVQARMAQQMPEEEKRARADHAILNDGDHPLVPQVWELDRLFRQLASERHTSA